MLVTHNAGRVPFLSFRVAMMIKTIFAPLYYALEQQVSQSLRERKWTTCSSIDFVLTGNTVAVEQSSSRAVEPQFSLVAFKLTDG
jgi:hypothetical protein